MRILAAAAILMFAVACGGQESADDADMMDQSESGMMEDTSHMMGDSMMGDTMMMGDSMMARDTMGGM